MKRAERPLHFQKLNSCVPVMQSAQDCMCDNVSEARVKPTRISAAFAY